MKYLGIDGCKAGWFVVAIDDSSAASFSIIRKINDIARLYSGIQIALIDIPIGLRTRHPDERLCDREARSVLVPLRNSSVFPAPSRCALECETFEEAGEMNRECTGRGLTKQTFGIIPRIREVDTYVRETNKCVLIREMHPEICFWALNNKVPIEHKKRSVEGYEERIQVLRRYYDDPEAIVNEAMRQYLRRDLARDDIVDALIGAVTAEHYQELHSHPVTPELDDYGLPMEIVYWDPN